MLCMLLGLVVLFFQSVAINRALRNARTLNEDLSAAEESLVGSTTNPVVGKQD